MSASQQIPWQELSMDAKECAALWKITPEHFLATYACQPTFPTRRSLRPSTWKAGEVIEWCDNNRAQKRRRT